jgi:hypothetical protein
LSPDAIGRTIELILAPVVLLSACSIFVNGVLNRYSAVANLIRALPREPLEPCEAAVGHLVASDSRKSTHNCPNCCADIG